MIKRKIKLNPGFYITAVSIISIIILLLDIALSSIFGILSEPLVYDGIAYCHKSEKLYNSFNNSGLLQFIKETFSQREPFWDFNIACSYILHGNDSDKAAYFARFIGIYAVLISYFYIAKKYSRSILFAFTSLIFAACLPLLSPSIRTIYSFNTIKSFKVLSDLRPDFMWGALLFATIVFIKENIYNNRNRHYLLIGCLSSIVIITKGSMAPVSIAILGTMGLIKLVVNRTKLNIRYFLKIIFALLPVIIVLLLWYYNGGLESNIDRIRNVMNNNQIVRRYSNYQSKYLGFISHLPFQIGVTEIVFTVSALCYFTYDSFKKKINLQVLFYFGFPFIMFCFQAINGPNPLKGAGAAFVFYAGFICAAGTIYKRIHENYGRKIELIILGILLVFIIGKVILIRNGIVHYNNQINQFELANNQRIYTTKESYEGMLTDLKPLLKSDARVFNNVYLFGGNEGINRFTNTKVKETWMNITKPKQVFLAEIRKSSIILIDTDVNDIRIHKQRKKHFNWLQEYLTNTSEFRLQKTYTIDVFKNKGSLQRSLIHKPRKISCYVNNSIH